MSATTTFRPTIKMVESASLALLDPEQTATAPGVAAPLSTLLRTLATAQRTHGADLDSVDGVRQTALYVLDHEHRRVTTDTKEPSSTADLLDALATSFGHEVVPGVEGDAAEAAFQYLIALRDDVRAGRVL